MNPDLKDIIKKGIESDIQDWEKTLRDEGYTNEDVEGVRNFLSKLSHDTIELIKNKPEKMAEIIEKLVKESEDDDGEDENYIKQFDELGEEELDREEEGGIKKSKTTTLDL
ncbi:hypothetical protein ACFL0U_02185 [Pseudomonadota bacterium]